MPLHAFWQFFYSQKCICGWASTLDPAAGAVSAYMDYRRWGP